MLQGTLSYRVHFSYEGEAISPWHDIPLAPNGLEAPLTFCCESAPARSLAAGPRAGHATRPPRARTGRACAVTGAETCAC